MTKSFLEKQCEEYNPDIELIGSGNVDYGHVLADRLLKQKESKNSEKMAEISKDLDFVEKVEKLRVDVGNYYSQLELKRKLIKEYKGYSRLNGPGNSKKSLNQASRTSQLGRAFESMYNSSLNKINKAFS